MFNQSGGFVHQLNDEERLATIALTATFNDTAYVNKSSQVVELIDLARSVSLTYLCQTIIYAHEAGMRDSVALLLAVLSQRSTVFFNIVFVRVVKDGRDIRNFVKVIRTGVTGRKSLGTLPKKLINAKLDAMTRYQLFAGSVGNNPSMADVIKLSHYCPNENNRDIVGWLLGNPLKPPEIVQLSYWNGASKPPELPFELWQQKIKDWTSVLPYLSFKQVITNINTIDRSFSEVDKSMVIKRIVDAAEIHRSKWFPFRFYTAAKFVNDADISKALIKAAFMAMDNVPELSNVLIAVDCSGSMQAPVTGSRPGATTKLSCIEAACVFATGIKMKTPNSRVVSFAKFAYTVHQHLDDPKQYMYAIQNKTRGGTNIKSVFDHIREFGYAPDLVIILSDNETWGHGAFDINNCLEWLNPTTKVVCWDLAPSGLTPMSSNLGRVLNIGGFSGEEFTLIEEFVNGVILSLADKIRSVSV